MVEMGRLSSMGKWAVAATTALLASTLAVVSPWSTSFATAATSQRNACIDGAGRWSETATPIAGQLSPGTVAVGDTITLEQTTLDFEEQPAALLDAVRSGLLRTAPTVADIGFADPTAGGAPRGFNSITSTVSLTLAASGSGSGQKTTTGTAGATFWAVFDGNDLTLFTGTSDPANGNTGLIPLSSLAMRVLLDDTSWTGTEPGQLSVTEAGTSPSDPLSPSNVDRAAAPLTRVATLNGDASRTLDVSCWPGQLGTATVTAPVPVQDGTPVLVPQTATANLGAPVTIRTLSGATGTAGIDPASVTIATPPAHGTATVNPATGDVVYQPAETSTTTPADSFTVTVAAPPPNETLRSLPTTQTITTITTTPLAAPVLVPQTATANLGAPVTIRTLSGATGTAGIDPASVTIATPPAHGTATVDPATGDVVYQPAETSTTTPADSFTVTVAAPPPNETLRSLPTTQTITTITTTPLAAPVLVPQTATANLGAPVTIRTLSGATGTAGIDPASVTIATPPAHGTATVDPATGDVVYQPAETSTTTPADSFTVTVAAPPPNETLRSLPTTQTITTITGDPPVGLDQSASQPLVSPVATANVKARPACADSDATLGRGQVTTVDALAACTDPSGPLSGASLVLVDSPTSGAVAIQPDAGAITYTSVSATSPEDSFTYRVVNADGIASNLATVRVRILGTTCSTSCTDITTQPVPITTQLDQSGGVVTFQPITLSGGARVATGTLNPLYVFSSSNTLGWSVTATVSDFVATPGQGTCGSLGALCIPALNLGWAPSATVVAVPADGPPPTVNAGPALSDWAHPEWSPVNGAEPTGTVPSVLCSSRPTAGTGTNGTFRCGADLFLAIPASVAARTYVATLTLTLG